MFVQLLAKCQDINQECKCLKMSEADLYLSQKKALKNVSHCTDLDLVVVALMESRSELVNHDVILCSISGKSF